MNSTALSRYQQRDGQDNVSQREFLALDSSQIIYINAKLKLEDAEEFIRIDPKFYAVTQRSGKLSENHHTNLSLFQFSSVKVAILSPPVLILYLSILKNSR